MPPNLFKNVFIKTDTHLHSAHINLSIALYPKQVDDEGEEQELSGAGNTR